MTDANLNEKGMVFVSRDRPRCGGCTLESAGGLCRNNWFKANLSIHTVNSNGASARVIIICFPGWVDAIYKQNQVSAQELFNKAMANDNDLLRDQNIRVYPWISNVVLGVLDLGYFIQQ